MQACAKPLDCLHSLVIIDGQAIDASADSEAGGGKGEAAPTLSGTRTRSMSLCLLCKLHLTLLGFVAVRRTVHLNSTVLHEEALGLFASLLFPAFLACFGISRVTGASENLLVDVRLNVHTSRSPRGWEFSAWTATVKHCFQVRSR